MLSIVLPIFFDSFLVSLPILAAIICEIRSKLLSIAFCAVSEATLKSPPIADVPNIAAVVPAVLVNHLSVSLNSPS